MALALPAAVLHVGPTSFAQGHAGGAKCPPKPGFNAPEVWTGLVGREKNVRQPPEGLSEAAEATRWHPKGPLRPASRWLGRESWHCQENLSPTAQISAREPQRVPPSGITLALAAPPLAPWTLSSESRHIYASFPLEIIQAGGCSATLSCFPHQEDRERSPRQLRRIFGRSAPYTPARTSSMCRSSTSRRLRVRRRRSGWRACAPKRGGGSNSLAAGTTRAADGTTSIRLTWTTRLVGGGFAGREGVVGAHPRPRPLSLGDLTTDMEVYIPMDE